MKRILVFCCIIGLALSSCQSGNPVASEEPGDLAFPYPGSSPDPMTSGMVVTRTHLIPVDPSELNIPLGTETYTCLWTSGTYDETGTWDWQDVDLTYTITSDGRLEIETINVLSTGVGQLATAVALYYPSDESRALNYDLFGSVTWGYLPQWPPWILIVDWSWSGLPHSHGISVQVDWASGYNIDSHHPSIPPIDGACGWPLVGNPPPPFTVNGL
jgi:hypothetical protein